MGHSQSFVSSAVPLPKDFGFGVGVARDTLTKKKVLGVGGGGLAVGGWGAGRRGGRYLCRG